VRPLVPLRSVLLVVLALASACDGGGLAPGFRRTPAGTGPLVRWEPYAEDLPVMPLPNDTATWPDPSSPTGRRLNASLLVPTALEARTRQLFDQLDGWGTFAPLSVSFDEDLDLASLLDRQGGTDHFAEADFARHAFYLVDLETGLPAPIDLNGGHFPYATTRPDQYFENDPRAGASNVVLETVEEDENGNGLLDPGEDTDFDGVLDHPSTIERDLSGDPLQLVDGMAWLYERETRTLIFRPILPLRPRTTYAVVLTDRLVGEDGQPVRSPFDHVHHVRQSRDLEPLAGHLAAHPELYGDLSARGWEGIAFAWTFTTQSVTDDLDVIREGLYGRGVMGRLASEFPVDAVPLPMQGGAGCPSEVPLPYVTPGDAFRETLATVAVEALDLPESSLAAMLESYASLSHVVTIAFESPYFFTDPENEDLEDVFDVDWQTGEARLTRETLTMNIYVPNETAEHAQPFDPVVYVHGHGSNAAEVLLYGGLVLQHGQALVAINAHGHGLGLSRAEQNLIRSYFADNCIEGMADAFLIGRARDLDGDGALDSGAHYWTAYAFHIRDSVRQTVIDEMNAFRILRSFDGARRAVPLAVRLPGGPPAEFDGDYDGDGAPDLAGDFDGDGTPDLGGDVDYRMAGGSLGGIITALTAGVEPNVVAAAPVVGGGGLADIAIRTENGAVLPAMLLRVMGPLVIGTPSAGPSAETTCAAGDVSLQFLATNLTDDVRTEFACLPAAELSPDDVLVVRNLTNDEVRCAGATGGVPGAFRVGVPSDAGDYWSVELYPGARDATDFGSCTIDGEPVPSRVIDTWEVGNGAAGEANCARCARFAATTFVLGEPLQAPAAGYGRRRQSPEMRRLLMLAQIALEPGDPINYVHRIFLEPLEVADVAPRPRSILFVNTVGDPNVPIATGYSLARAAGVVPFLPPDAPDHLADFRAPVDFSARYPGFATPNDVYIGLHAIEGLPRLARHPAGPGAESFLADVDDLAEGRAAFATDGRTQLTVAEGGFVPVRLTPGVRWSRRSRRMTAPGEDLVWTYDEDAPNSGMIAPYVQPRGIHGFDELFDDTLAFDMAVYMFNLLGRYVSTNGTDLPYLSDPGGHHCLEDSSCSYLVD